MHMWRQCFEVSVNIKQLQSQTRQGILGSDFKTEVKERA